MPLILTPEHRRQIAHRMMIQNPPTEKDALEFQKFAKAHSKAMGLPADVMLALEVLVDLAEQGNPFAAALYMDECDRLGIEFRRKFF